MKKLSLIGMLALLVSVQAFADGENANSSPSSIHYKAFQVGGMYTTQGPGESWSGIIRYSPYFALKENIHLGISIGIAPQKRDDTTNFVETEFLANGRYFLNDEWSAQVSAGGQNWSSSNGGFAFSGGVAAFYGLKTSFLKDVFVQYLYVGQSQSANQWLAGVSIEF